MRSVNDWEKEAEDELSAPRKAISAIDISNIEMETRACQCCETETFRVMKGSPQRFCSDWCRIGLKGMGKEAQNPNSIYGYKTKWKGRKGE